MATLINNTVLVAALDWAYDKALQGMGPLQNAYILAEEHLAKASSTEAAARQLINRQIANCATSGFVTGLGGLITLPLAVPANLSSVLLLQLRMILALAVMGGYDPRTEQVKTLALACLTGNSANSILTDAGVKTGELLTQRVIANIGEHVLNKIQYLVKAKLLVKTTRVGLVKLGKVVPLVGGVVGGTIDAASTRLVGKAAMEVFGLRR